MRGPPKGQYRLFALGSASVARGVTGRTLGARSCRMQGIHLAARRRPASVPLPFRTFGEVLAHGLGLELWCTHNANAGARPISRHDKASASPAPGSAAGVVVSAALNQAADAGRSMQPLCPSVRFRTSGGGDACRRFQTISPNNK